MSSSRPLAKGGKTDEAEEWVETTRLPSPPPHTTYAVRGVHVPSFSSFQPRDLRISSSHPVTHVAWSCDGRRLASVGPDKSVRLWSPEKSLESRNALQFHGGHDYDVDYVAWNPTHPELFVSSSQRDRQVVFWDARRTIYSHHLPPAQLSFAPNGKTLSLVSTSNQLWFLEYGAPEGGGKEQWHRNKRDAIMGTTALFNHVGDGMVMAHVRSNSLMVADYPSLVTREQPAAHVGGCIALALDPRGRYLASGGHDSIVNLFDLTEWICVNTITSCDHSINALSFSHDGEYIAIASQGSYIDICGTETGLPLHRVQALGPSPTVTWHPSKYVLAYCGQTKPREGAAPLAFMSLYGPGL